MIERISGLSLLVEDSVASRRLFESTLGFKTLVTNQNTFLGSRETLMYSGNSTYLRLLEPVHDKTTLPCFVQSTNPGPCIISFDTDDYKEALDRFTSCGIHPVDVPDESVGSFALFKHEDLNNVLMEVRQSGCIGPETKAGESGCTMRTIGLRQVAILVNDIESAIAKWSALFQTEVTNRFETSFTDLDIAILPVGDRSTFIELAHPKSVDSSAAKFLRRHGSGVYLAIYEIRDSLAVDALLLNEGVDFTTSRKTTNYTDMGFNSIWIHPKFMHGMFVQLSEVLTANNPWPPAGGNWF